MEHTNQCAGIRVQPRALRGRSQRCRLSNLFASITRLFLTYTDGAMTKRLLLTLAAVCAVSFDGSISAAKAPAAATSFPLTVDSIMRGPKLVGYPPSDLRWSGDSKELFFEWRMHGEDEAATWVVSRDGGTPRRLSDEERRVAPLTNGAWDQGRRRILGTDRGDVVVIDTIARKRLEVTRTTGNEASPRWARGGTHVTFVRDNNPFIVPVDGPASGMLLQLADVGPRRTETRPTDSQR